MTSASALCVYVLVHVRVYGTVRVGEPHGASEINSKPSTSRCCLSIALFRASTSTLLHRRRHHQPIAISTFILIPIVIPTIIVIVVLLLVQPSQLEKCYRFLFPFKFAKTPTLSGLSRLEATSGPLNDSFGTFSVYPFYGYDVMLVL